VHPDDLAGGFSDLEMTWLIYCAGAATEWTVMPATDNRRRRHCVSGNPSFL